MMSTLNLPWKSSDCVIGWRNLTCLRLAWLWRIYDALCVATSKSWATWTVCSVWPSSTRRSGSTRGGRCSQLTPSPRWWTIGVSRSHRLGSRQCDARYVTASQDDDTHFCDVTCSNNKNISVWYYWLIYDYCRCHGLIIINVQLRY